MARRKRKKVKQTGLHRGHSSAAALLKGLNHPVRIQALAILTDRTAGPRDIAAALDKKISCVSYHIRVLEELELIELVDEKAVRGAIAHFYRATEPAAIRAVLGQLPPEATPEAKDA